MLVVIDNSNRQEVVFHYYLNNQWKEKSFMVTDNQPLLFYFDKLLKITKQTKENLIGLAVLIGQGSFTSTRIATTLANVFGYVLHIPILGVPEIKLTDLKEKVAKTKIGQYISATYSGEPNINLTKSKKLKV
jgi:tRNA A37 threonylcarbamoyladenosine modification protein TsaB